MARSPKTPKFKAFNSYPNCYGPNQDEPREIWDWLDDSRPLVLEIGCGKAELSLELAKRHPAKNFIGIDLKADRLYAAASTAIDEGLTNMAFIQTDTRRLSDYLDDGSVTAIWLTFPDPYPKDRQAKHRLSGGQFLPLYHKLLRDKGRLHFKTDSLQLFDWSLDELETQKKLFKVDFKTDNLHAEASHEDAKVITFYEQQFLDKGLKTCYLVAKKV